MSKGKKKSKKNLNRVEKILLATALANLIEAIIDLIRKLFD